MIEPVWIDTRDALALHERLLSIHGGAEGLRDLALLESALARPRQLLAYADESEIVDLAVPEGGELRMARRDVAGVTR